MQTITDVLKQHGYSVTKARQNVFNALIDSGPLSMAQLTNKVRARMDRASVYRTVELFEKLGVINRIQIGWKYKLELSDLFTEHHHHATCMQCSKVVSFEESPEFDAHLLAIGKELSFAITSHSLEIRGLCADCQMRADTLA